MALTADDDAFLKKVLGNLADKPLEAGSPFYEPIHTVMDDDDPVWLMQRHVELNDSESLQLFSGFRGAGKTTELLRLKAILEERGYIVLYADALDYINPAEPVEISDLIMVLAGSFSDALLDLVEGDVEHESFWTRFANFLTNTEVRLTGIDLKAEGGPGSVKAGMTIKAEFKTGSTFRQRLQSALSGRLSELKAEADAFFESGIKLIRESFSQDRQVVFIFDQLEQVRGNYQNWQAVIRSVEQVFTIHIDKLRLPYIHAIFAVPPWLKFLTTLEAPMTILPTVHLWQNDIGRTHFDPGWTAYHALLDRRLGEDGKARLFGPERARADACCDRLIGACGGHVRDLLRLFQEMVKRAASLPVTDRVLQRVVDSARRDFLPIALDDAQWLAEIAERRDTALAHIDERSIERLSNFLDQHRVIYFVNGAAWYDIHPLIRDEVKRVVEAGNPPEPLAS
jgi:hypothetical protein